jgi:hypothetical protein
MAYEMKAGQGSLFKNDKKTTESQPALKGKVMLPNGEVRWLSAWSKVTASGDKWLSLSVGDLVPGQPAPVQGQQQAAAKPAALVDLDDDIPF